MLLFVYGTLKRGGRNHRRLAGQRFVRTAATAPGFRLFDLGPFPGMVFDKSDGAVTGELFAVSDECVGELDEFEGVPDLFDRRVIVLADGTKAWAYLYVQPIPAGAPGGEEWPLPTRPA